VASQADVIRLPVGGSNAGPFPAVRALDGSIRTADSFGDYGFDEAALAIDPSALLNAPRVGELRFRASFYRGQQHDLKVHDFEGRLIPGPEAIRTTQPYLKGAVPSQYVPLSSRRPSAPYRLPRKIVRAFTGLLFGHGRWPQMRSSDPETQAFAEALVEASSLAVQMLSARNLGGSAGTVGLSWAFVDGAPRVRVHSGDCVHVVAWEDRDEFLPSHVVELYRFDMLAPDDRGNMVPQSHWFRRDWTPLADVAFHPEIVRDEPPMWRIDEEQTVVHNDGFPHFVWIVNQPSDEPSDIDGVPDYDQTYEQSTSIDVLNSVLVHGTVRNLDPTLVLKVDEETMPRGGAVSKGSTTALSVGSQGDAKYLELSGTAATAGKTVLEMERDQMLEVCDCVLLDPDKAAASGSSSVALKAIYAPMLTAADVLRMQYGKRGIERLVNGMIISARRRMPDPDGVVEEAAVVPVFGDDDEPIVDEETGEPVLQEAEFFLRLPPRIIREPVLDAEGNPTGEETERHVEHVPGAGLVTVEWGEYFKATADDKQKSIGTVQNAAGAKPVLSQRTAVELVANMLDRDANAEWDAVSKEEAARREADGSLFTMGAGGAVLPTDGETPAPTQPLDGDGLLTATDMKLVVLVHEARAAKGLPPLMKNGARDPDNDLTVASYEAKQNARQTAKGEAIGEVEAEAIVESATPGVEPELPAEGV